MPTRSPAALLRSAGLALPFGLLACSHPTASNETVATSSQQVTVTPTAPESAQNRSAAASLHGRNYVAWVGTDDNHSINVAWTPSCALDAKNQNTWNPYFKSPPFSGERGSADQKAGLAMATSPDGLRLYLVYTGSDNKVYLKWMFVDGTQPVSVDHWSGTITLPGSGREDDAPSIAVDADSIFVAFTDTDNYIHVDHAVAPTGTPLAGDTITFDQSVALPHDGQVHRTDNGPSLTFYHSGFGLSAATDHLLLAYTTQTQCTDGITQTCRNLVLDFLDTTDPSMLAQPSGVEFTRIYDDSTAKNDYAFSPAILGLADGVAFAWRQNRDDWKDNASDKNIQVLELSDDQMTGLFANARSVGAGHVYGDFTSGERGIPWPSGPTLTYQDTPNDPNLAALTVCNGTSPAIPAATAPALVWRGNDSALNVFSGVVGLPACPFTFPFKDTTDHTTTFANAQFDDRMRTVVRDYACIAPAGSGPANLARLAFPSVFPDEGGSCTPGGVTTTEEARASILAESCVGMDIGTKGNGEWDVESNRLLRERLLPSFLDDKAQAHLLYLVTGTPQQVDDPNLQSCEFRQPTTGVVQSGDEWYNYEVVKETENHLLFIEGNRFLYNQLPSSPPGLNTTTHDGWTEQGWIMARLQKIFETYFYEYNSPTYEAYHAAAVGNLFENTTSDPEIKTGARMILDLLSAHEASATKDLRRMATFRRHPTDWNADDLLANHEERDRFQILTGETRMLHDTCSQYAMNQVATAIGTYRIPDPILDRLINRAHQRGFERIHLGDRGSVVMSGNTTDHRVDGWEVFYQDPDFLLTSGGIATENQYTRDCGFGGWCGGENENGRDVYTTLMPTGTFTSAGLTIHIESPMELNTNTEYDLSDGSGLFGPPANIPLWRKTCLGPNFACGQQVDVPDGLCQKKVGQFTVVDFTQNQSPDCAGKLRPAEPNSGFYAAVVRGNDNWGFFEVEGVKTVGGTITTLDEFAQHVTDSNLGRTWTSAGANTYTTLQGDTIQFAPIRESFEAWNLTGIKRNCDAAINKTACLQQAVPVADGSAPATAPLAEGDFFTNTDPTTGIKNPDRLWIPNPYTCQEVVMDYSQMMNPFYVDPQNPTRRLCDSGGGACSAPCTATSTTACSCPTSTQCAPPSDVTGPMSVDACRGFFAKFAVGAAACPGQVGVWNGSPGFGERDATVLQSNGTPAMVVRQGDQVGAPEVGFQIDFPSLPATTPAGCSTHANKSGTQVTCEPVKHGETLELVPGAYDEITVSHSGTLVLHPGDYMFEALRLEPGARLHLPTGQRVRVLTKNAADLGADVKCFDASGVTECNPDDAASRFGVMDLGTSDVVVGTALAGTIVAPRASIVVLPGSGGVTHGAFWSKKRVTVLPWGKIVMPSANVFFDSTEASAYPACAAR